MPLPERVERGLVVGKFCPLHLGHERLIDFAATRCTQLLVIGWSQPGFAGYSAARRERWLRARFPGQRWRCWMMRGWRPCVPNMACRHACCRTTATASKCSACSPPGCASTCSVARCRRYSPARTTVTALRRRWPRTSVRRYAMSGSNAHWTPGRRAAPSCAPIRTRTAMVSHRRCTPDTCSAWPSLVASPVARPRWRG